MGTDISPAATGIFRTVIERSVMQNNDEWASYSDRPVAFDDAAPHRLVFSRPVYETEVEAGLRTEPGSLFDRNEPEITKVIDAVWRLREKLSAFAALRRAPDLDIAKSISHIIAYDYCDCMSGGMPRYVVSIVRWACEEFGVPGETEVYPGAERWYTVSDFLAETADAPDVRVVDSAQDMSRLLLPSCDVLIEPPDAEAT